MAKTSSANSSRTPANARIRLITAAVASGLPVARELWSVINKDDRAAQAVRDTWSRARHAVVASTPVGHVEATLDAVVSYAQGSDQHEAADWLASAGDIRARLDLVKLQKGRQRRVGVKDAQRRAADLLAAVIGATG